MMPSDLILHVRNALALDRMGDHAQRLGAIRRQRERVEQRPGIVAVDIDDVPAEGAELVGERLDVVGVGDARALLQACCGR